MFMSRLRGCDSLSLFHGRPQGLFRCACKVGFSVTCRGSRLTWLAYLVRWTAFEWSSANSKSNSTFCVGRLHRKSGSCESLKESIIFRDADVLHLSGVLLYFGG